ncbi:MAG: hypothetical protein MI924_15885, partial [Chloroflexales bacterium]|nr:hypothetical protein [Chloroflexales bacterium]
IGEQQTETIEGSWVGPVQWFERDRLEDHSNEGLGVLAGRLGALYLERVSGRPWETLPKASGAPPDCRFFPETKHTLCEPFLSYWQNNGGLARFGYPLSEVFREVIGEQTYTVQYFERRRMELHPENPPPYTILLGLLGKSVYAADQYCGGEPWFFSPAPPLCPRTAVEQRDGAAQSFERGFMIWTREPDVFYIFYSKGESLRYAIIRVPYTFQTAPPVDETPPPGRSAPVSGFGSVWRGEIVVRDLREPLRDLLGWAIEPEYPYTMELQCQVAPYPTDERCYLRAPGGEIVWFGRVGSGRWP